MAASGAEIAYDLALRAVDAQRARLDNLRSRAGIQLAVVSLVTSFLGAEALKDTKLDAMGQQVADRSLQSWEAVAILAFLAAISACLWMLRPQRNRWRFELSARDVIRDYVDDPTPDVADVHYDLALYLEDNYDLNEPHLGRLMWWQQLATAALAVEIAAWILDLTV